MKKAAFYVARLMHYAFSYRATKPVSFDGRSVAQFGCVAVKMALLVTGTTVATP